MADKEREIFLWTVKYPNRDENSTTDLLVWQKNLILITTTIVDSVSYPPIWDKANQKLLKKGTIIVDLISVRIPYNMVDNEKELYKIIGDISQYQDYDWKVSFRKIVKPRVYNEFSGALLYEN